MLYKIVIIISKLVCCLPLRCRMVLGEIISRIAWPMVPAQRLRMAADNIMTGLAVDRKEAEDIAKASTVRFGQMLMEVLYIPKLNKDNINQYVKIEGEEHLEKALSLGRGVIIATAHTGNWEILGAALAMHGFPIIAVVQQQSSTAMDKFINEYRTLAGMHVTYRNSVREMVKMLAAGKIVGLLIDQDSGKGGVFVEFFGRLASTAPGAAALSRLNGSPIVPLFITYNGDGTHTAVIHPRVDVNKTEDRDYDILVTTRYLTSIVENHIRKHPKEWFWLHNRWKTPPPD